MLAQRLIERKRDGGRIEVGEWRALMNAYAAGHIPGAINIPTSQLRGRAAAELPDVSQPIVAYCGGPT